jgi:hypothetical protein
LEKITSGTDESSLPKLNKELRELSKIYPLILEREALYSNKNNLETMKNEETNK